MAGMTARLDDPMYRPPPNRGGIKSVYDAAATTQAEDYDDIMRGYDDILSSAKNNRNSQLNYVPINPIFNRQLQGSNYERSSDLNSVITGLKSFADTGGYSDADIRDIRERSISPIRSIYSSAQEGLRRQKVLQGGYSPNYGAVSAKMARDASSRIGDITTKVNADVAQMIAAGKLSGLQSLTPTVARENELINATNQRNIDLKNEVERQNNEERRRVDEINRKMQLQIDEINNRNKLQNTNTQLQANQGKQSLYGTTPALTQTFANQVLQNNQQNLQAAQTANMIKNQRANIGLNLVNSQLNPSGAGGSWRARR